MSKKLYEQPTTKVLVVRFGGVLCLSGGEAGQAGKAGAAWSPTDDSFYDYGDL